MRTWCRVAAVAIGTWAALGAVPPVPLAAGGGSPTYRLLKQDVIVNADVWAKRPKMMAAGLGFTNIIGVPGLRAEDLTRSEQLARAAGGTWNTIACASGESAALGAYTSAATPQQVANAYGSATTLSDGLPVEFSWPIRPSTLDPTDFRITFNTGRTVVPDLASIYPNEEYNERSVAVLFGTFGNRLPSSAPGAEYPVLTEVVRDRTPLQLVGPNDRIVSAVGYHASASTSPYDDPNAPLAERTGPRLVAAKLTRLSTTGENAPKPFRVALPNDGRTLYGKQARFRLRIYTSGGFSPDGVRAVFPTEFSRYFRLHARGRAYDMVLDTTNHTYRIAGHPLRILGLADLGPKQQSYDDCYREDKDNYIDIVIAGQAAAVRRITSVEIPAAGRYGALYNPGGPGNNPTSGVRYTAPGPSQRQPVWVALDNPMTVTFVRGPYRSEP
jgi:hypothetical protein